MQELWSSGLLVCQTPWLEIETMVLIRIGGEGLLVEHVHDVRVRVGLEDLGTGDRG